ncbi:MAG: ankyrin repeat protein [Flavobacteriales bacterium]|jgi:ankyrin repeat protein
MEGGNWKGMFEAAQTGDIELVRYYIRTGVDSNYQHPEYMASILVESIRFGHIDIMKLLLENGCDPKVKEMLGGDTPLSVAIEKKNQQAIDMLNSYLK